MSESLPALLASTTTVKTIAWHVPQTVRNVISELGYAQVATLLSQPIQRPTLAAVTLVST